MKFTTIQILRAFITYADADGNINDFELCKIEKQGIQLLSADMQILCRGKSFDMTESSLTIFEFVEKIDEWQKKYNIGSIPKQLSVIRPLKNINDEIISKFPCLDKFDYFQNDNNDIDADLGNGDMIHDFFQEIAKYSQDSTMPQFAKKMIQKLHIQV